VAVRWAPSDRRRRLLLFIAIALASVVLLLGVSSGFYIDLLWFREVGHDDVFWTTLRTEFGLGLVFGLAFFAMLYANLVFVRRLTPKYRVLSPEQEIVERYRVAFEPYLSWLVPGFAALLGLFVGIGASSRWQEFLLWRNGSDQMFGVNDPQFGRDVSYYVFAQPWYTFVQGWLFSSLIGVTILTAIAHYLWGNIRTQGVGERVTPQVRAHLSVLLGLVVFLKAWGYWLQRYDLLVSPRGVVTGASYTDVHAQLPALTLLVFIAILCGLLFLANIRLRNWALPILGVGLLALSSVVVGGIYPAAIQRFRVEPQEQQNEEPFIELNIEFTRSAFGLDGIEIDEFPVDPQVTAEDVGSNESTIANIRLWRPEVLKRNLQSLQRVKPYYEFNDVDVDRYVIGGERRVVMVAAREVNQDGIPGGGTWQTRHLAYTHGFGGVATQVNTATPEGAPLFQLKDLPPQGTPELEMDQPRVYFGEQQEVVPFVVVNSGTGEIDEESGSSFEYDGAAGIEIDSFVRRLMFAARYRDFNILLSNQITDGSRILINRDISVRVPKVAPFLVYDWDPYAAIVDGRIVWIWDAYTTTDRYPYSQEVDLAAATDGLIEGTANYMRNSVKVVVDAYDGTTTYYVVDEEDPIIAAWRGAFPELFTPVSEAPADLLAHFRYPENLFQVQTAQYASYHVDSPADFYNRRDFWALPQDPTVEGTVSPLRPYYLLVTLPGETQAEFVLVQPLTPVERQNMVAWMAARSDWGDGFGEIVVKRFPTGRNVDGPTQAFSRINQDPDFSAERTLFGQSGSDVIFGDFLVIPVGDSILSVAPVYVESQQENALPELKRVVVVNGEKVGLGATLVDALSDAIGAEVTEPDGGPGPGAGAKEQIAALLADASARFDAADAALQAGDLAQFQREIEAARALIEQAEQLAAGEKGAEAPASPSPEASP